MAEVSYKDTLNLPTTSFPIRPQAAVDDPAMLERWEHEQLYAASYVHNLGKKKYILHDGPPYANGPIHLGHAYNKILKDIIGKSKRMSGYHVPITPGWDCHGLPIELKVSSEQPQLAGAELKKACRAYASHWIDEQRTAFKALGVLMDWAHPYKTMDTQYEAAILRAFGTLVARGFIERKKKTVPWCFSCKTVLAAAEIEYEDRTDPSVYVLFPLHEQVRGKVAHLLVWTTTPWTLPLNRAVFVHPKSTYVLLEHNDTIFIVGAALADVLCAALGIEKRVIVDVPSTELVGLHATHPFAQRTVPVLADSFVSLTDGTACVHSAPGCGPEDYEMGIRYDLEIYSPLNPDGTYTQEIEPKELRGKSIIEGQQFVLESLEGRGLIVHRGKIQHAYPHCWRCRKGLMFRATAQWFCNLEHAGLKQKALDAIEGVNFVPERSGNFLRAAVSSRLEWCISRQRSWGVPIIAVLCSNNDWAYTDDKLIQFVAQHFEQEGVEFWDRVQLSDLPLPQDLVCPVCTSKAFTKETDILDVWFDSGVSHYAVLRHNKSLAYPADLYCEGLDQHRGWFQSSLLTSIALEEAVCFKGILTHGFTVDEQGRKMSKSLGNVVTPQELIKDLGTDGLRLWVSSISSDGDAIVSDVLLNNVKEVYRKVRNTCRFLLSNLSDFDYERDLIPYQQLMLLDRLALAQLAAFEREVLTSYEKIQPTGVSQAFGSFSAHASSLFLDMLKDRLYVESASGLARRSAQTVCYYMLDTMTRLIAPVLSFTAEQLSDLYQKNKTTSIHLQSFSTLPAPVYEQHKMYMDYLAFALTVRDALLKLIEVERSNERIKHSLQARVIYYLGPTITAYAHVRDMEKIESLPAFLAQWLIVSQVVSASSAQGLEQTTVPGLYARIEHAQGSKCPRCWQWQETTHEHQLCPRCERVVQNNTE